MVDIDVNGVAYPYPSSAADTNTAAEQVAFQQAVAEAITTNTVDLLEVTNAVAALDDVTWVALPLLNGWGNQGAPNPLAASYLDPFRVAHVRMSVNGGATGAGSPICTLPVGQRPPYNVNIYVNCNDNSGPAEIIIEPSGAVYVNPLTGDASAGGITFEMAFSVASGP